MKKKEIRFPYKPPIFTPFKEKLWESSVYYWWWEYLRRHEGYKKTCVDNGNGEFDFIYSQFGNVHGTTFKKWWHEDNRGAELFSIRGEMIIEDGDNVAVLSVPEDVQIVTKEDKFPAEDLYLTIKFPLYVPKRLLKREFNKILKEKHPSKRGGVFTRKPFAAYVVEGNPRINSLKTGIQIYDLRMQEGLTYVEIGNRIFKALRIVPKDDRETIIEKKNVLNATVSRYLKKVKRTIENTGIGEFP